MKGSDRDRVGGFIGLLVFTIGIGLVGYTFYRAFDLFSIPPEVTLGIKPGQPMNVDGAVSALVRALLQVLLLVVMAVVAGIVANRGIKLYAASRETSGGSLAPAESKPAHAKEEPRPAKPT